MGIRVRREINLHFLIIFTGAGRPSRHLNIHAASSKMWLVQPECAVHTRVAESVPIVVVLLLLLLPVSYKKASFLTQLYRAGAGCTMDTGDVSILTYRC